MDLTGRVLLMEPLDHWWIGLSADFASLPPCTLGIPELEAQFSVDRLLYTIYRPTTRGCHHPELDRARRFDV